MGLAMLVQAACGGQMTRAQVAPSTDNLKSGVETVEYTFTPDFLKGHFVDKYLLKITGEKPYSKQPFTHYVSADGNTCLASNEKKPTSLKMSSDCDETLPDAMKLIGRTLDILKGGECKFEKDEDLPNLDAYKVDCGENKNGIYIDYDGANSLKNFHPTGEFLPMVSVVARDGDKVFGKELYKK